MQPFSWLKGAAAEAIWILCGSSFFIHLSDPDDLRGLYGSLYQFINLLLQFQF